MCLYSQSGHSFHNFKMMGFTSVFKSYWNGVRNSKALIPIRNNSSCKFKYPNELEIAVNKQIDSELQAALMYLKMAVHFLHPSVSYIGIGGYFMKMYEEELQHMKHLINYQLTRGGKPEIKICMSETDLTLVEAFQKALDMEKNITEQLESVVNIAESVKDYQCADFVTSKFLEEQMCAINQLSHHITNLTKLGDGKHALYHYDHHLAKLYPYSLKI